MAIFCLSCHLQKLTQTHTEFFWKCQQETIFSSHLLSTSNNSDDVDVDDRLSRPMLAPFDSQEKYFESELQLSFFVLAWLPFDELVQIFWRLDFGSKQRLSERKFTQQRTQYESWSTALIPQWNKLLWCLLSSAVARNFKYHTLARTKKLEH